MDHADHRFEDAPFGTGAVGYDATGAGPGGGTDGSSSAKGPGSHDGVAVTDLGTPRGTDAAQIAGSDQAAGAAQTAGAARAGGSAQGVGSAQGAGSAREAVGSQDAAAAWDRAALDQVLGALAPDQVCVRVSGTGTPLELANRWQLLSNSDVQLATSLQQLFADTDPWVGLAIALTAAVNQQGSSALPLDQAEALAIEARLDLVDLDSVTREQVALAISRELDWPDALEWSQALAASPLVSGPEAPVNATPVRLADGLVYLERHWDAEQRIAAAFRQRANLTSPSIDSAMLRQTLTELHQYLGHQPTDEQLHFVQTVANAWTSVLTGGPGTGKTTSVALALAALQQGSGQQLQVGLAAPSGKAAGRLRESVEAGLAPLVESGVPVPAFSAGLTVNRLLGLQGLSLRARHGQTNPVPYDVVVVDEASMISLLHFALLLEAVGPTTRLLVVGDADQLQPVGAGNVLSDVIASGLAGGVGGSGAVTRLTRNQRFGVGPIATLASAILAGRADEALALLTDQDPSTEDAALGLIDLPPGAGWNDLGSWGRDEQRRWVEVAEAAERGDQARALALLDQHRTLCAHREGDYGVGGWTARTLAWVQAVRPGFGRAEFYPGRPILVTRNDQVLAVNNGDVGVVISQRNGLAVAIAGSPIRQFGVGTIADLTSLYAMTVHKSQGSQFRDVTLVLPPLHSPLLTRDLLYTAVTRATDRVRIIGSAEQLRQAVLTEGRRASGLRRYLRA